LASTAKEALLPAGAGTRVDAVMGRGGAVMLPRLLVAGLEMGVGTPGVVARATVVVGVGTVVTVAAGPVVVAGGGGATVVVVLVVLGTPVVVMAVGLDANEVVDVVVVTEVVLVKVVLLLFVVVGGWVVAAPPVVVVAVGLDANEVVDVVVVTEVVLDLVKVVLLLFVVVGGWVVVAAVVSGPGAINCTSFRLAIPLHRTLQSTPPLGLLVGLPRASSSR
jgi:hypothetical protein